mgnify:CR=1 FL=1
MSSVAPVIRNTPSDTESWKTISRSAQPGARLISRRTIEVSNSNGQDLPAIRKEMPHNPAFMNPADLADLGVPDGGLIQMLIVPVLLTFGLLAMGIAGAIYI